MAGKRRFGVMLSLGEHLKRQKRQQLEESSRQMIEAEQALFVAIRLARPASEISETDAAQASTQPPPKTSSSRKKTAA